MESEWITLFFFSLTVCLLAPFSFPVTSLPNKKCRWGSAWNTMSCSNNPLRGDQSSPTENETTRSSQLNLPRLCTSGSLGNTDTSATLFISALTGSQFPAISAGVPATVSITT